MLSTSELPSYGKFYGGVCILFFGTGMFIPLISSDTTIVLQLHNCPKNIALAPQMNTLVWLSQYCNFHFSIRSSTTIVLFCVQPRIVRSCRHHEIKPFFPCLLAGSSVVLLWMAFLLSSWTFGVIVFKLNLTILVYLPTYIFLEKRLATLWKFPQYTTIT